MLAFSYCSELSSAWQSLISKPMCTSATQQLVAQADIHWQSFGLRIQATTATYVEIPSIGARICSGVVFATGISAGNVPTARKLTRSFLFSASCFNHPHQKPCLCFISRCIFSHLNLRSCTFDFTSPLARCHQNKISIPHRQCRRLIIWV